MLRLLSTNGVVKTILAQLQYRYRHSTDATADTK